MKKFFKIIILIIFLVPFISVNAKENKINIYFFYGEGCPHCREENIFLDKISTNENIEIKKYEVWKNNHNKEILNKIQQNLDITTTSVPITIIGKTIIYGYNDSIKSKIERAINFYKINEYEDIVDKILNNTYKKEIQKDLFLEQEEKYDKKLTFNLPIIKNINLKSLPLETAIFLLALVDNININGIILILTILTILYSSKDIFHNSLKSLIYIFLSSTIYIILGINNININKNIYLFIILTGIIILLINIKNKIPNKINILYILLATIFLIVIPKDNNILNLYNEILTINNIKTIKYLLYTILYIFFNSIGYIIFTLLFTYISMSKNDNKLYKYSKKLNIITTIFIILIMIIKIR